MAIGGHVFISYVREDSEQVDALQRVLDDIEIPVWRDTASLWPGDSWRDVIRRAITDDALVFVACFSRNGLARDKSYQNEELSLAVEQLRLRRPDVPWLIPVRFDDCPIPDWDIGGGRTLRSIQRADLFGDEYGIGVARLVTAILTILSRYPGAGGSSARRGTGPAGSRTRRRTRRRWLTSALTATSVAAVAVAFAVYISKPSTFTMSGTLTIKQSSNKQSSNAGLIAGPRPDCHGAGGLTDLSAGTAVIVKDPEGRQVAVGVLQVGKLASGNKNWCVLTFSVPDVPGGLPLYSVTISNRGTVAFTPEEAQTGVAGSHAPLGGLGRSGFLSCGSRNSAIHLMSLDAFRSMTSR